MKTPSRHVALDPHIEAELLIAAADADRSVSYIVRQAINEYFAARRGHAARSHRREERPA
jgi:hypothetical protein